MPIFKVFIEVFIVRFQLQEKSDVGLVIYGFPRFLTRVSNGLAHAPTRRRKNQLFLERAV